MDRVADVLHALSLSRVLPTSGMSRVILFALALALIVVSFPGDWLGAQPVQADCATDGFGSYLFEQWHHDCDLDNDPSGGTGTLISGGGGGGGGITGHLFEQADNNNDGMGDIYAAIYDVKDIVLDPDQDNSSNRREYKWGTIPVVEAEPRIDVGETGLYLPWAKDTDDDGLDDLAESQYWNDYGNRYDSDVGTGAEATTALYAAKQDHAVRDPDSLLDFDGDACTKPGNNYTTYNETWEPDLKGCSHVADDPDSDNDGLSDGSEVAKPTDNQAGGIGRWTTVDDSPVWEVGAYAWAPDSDCRDDQRRVNGATAYCVGLWNYHNETDPNNGYAVPHLHPGFGDGLNDSSEKERWTNLSETQETRYNPTTGQNESLWDWHEDHDAWDDIDDEDRQLSPYEIDFDKDGAMPLLDRDSDEDGYTDLAELQVSSDPPPIPDYVINRSDASNRSEWKAQHVPDCVSGTPLPYANDSDADELSDQAECGTEADPNNSTKTNPRNWDHDGDGMPDGWEAQFSDLSGVVDDASGDIDKDGVTNVEEYCYRPDSDDGQKYGCDSTKPEAYWTHNPCSLHPNNTDTDSDGFEDGEERTQGTNAANSDNDLLGGSCPAGQDATADAYQSYNPSALHGDQNLSNYSDSLRTDVANDAYDTATEAKSQTIYPWNTTQRAVSRAENTSQAIREKYNQVVNNSSLVASNGTGLQQFVERTYETTGVVDNIVRQPIQTAQDTLDLLTVTEKAPSAPSDELLKTVPLGQVQNLQPRDTVSQATKNPGQFVTGLANNTTDPLTSPAHGSESAAVERNDGMQSAPSQDPYQLTKSEGVVPDLVFSLLKTVDETVEGVNETAAKTYWDVYKEQRDADAEHLTDSSHYKAMLIGPNGTVRITPNKEVGTKTHVDVDNNDSTGADTSCTTLDACSYSEGDDLTLEITVEEETAEGTSSKTIYKPTLTLNKIDDTEEVPWLVMGFMLPYTSDQGSDTLGTEDSHGYVAYAGFDGRPNSTTPTTGNLTLEADRSYEVQDLPDQAQFGLVDFSIVPKESTISENVSDPSNELAVNLSFTDDRIDYDTAALGGIAQYKLHDEKGKQIWARGNTTNLTTVLRGTPDSIQASYETLNRTIESGGTQVNDRKLFLNWTANGGPADDDGIDVALQRTSNRHGIRNQTSLLVSTSELPDDGSYGKNVTYRPNETQGREREQVQRLSINRTVDDAYLRFHRWTHLERGDSDPVQTTRLRSQPLPQKMVATARPDNETYRVHASQPIRNLAYVDAANDQVCKDLSALGTTNYYLQAPNETTTGCLEANLRGFQTIEASLSDGQLGGGALNISYERNESVLNASRPDTAALELNKHNWLQVTTSDLPEALTLETRGASSTTDGKQIDLDYRFTPNVTVDRFDVRGALAVPNADEPADLKLHMEGLPSEGHGTIDVADKTVDISFLEPLDFIRFHYAETQEVPNIDGSHVTVTKQADTDGGRAAVNGSLHNFKEFHFNASSPDRLSISGDVDEPRQTRLYVNVPTDLDTPGKNDFMTTLSSLPGTFDLFVETPSDREFHLDGNVSEGTTNGDPSGGIQQLDLEGSIQGRNYNVTLENLQVFHVDYEKRYPTLANQTQSVDLGFDVSRPLTIEGRVVSLDATNDAGGFPAAPASLGDHLMRIEEDGAVTLSLQLTDLNGGNLRWADHGETYDLDASYDLEGPRSFYLYERGTTETADPRVVVGEFDQLPGNLTLHAEPGIVDYDATEAIDNAALEIRDPDEDLRLQTRLKDLPERVDAAWTTTEQDQAHAEIDHSGQSLTEAFLEFQDKTAGQEQYLRAHVEELPSLVTLDATRTDPLVVNATAFAPNGSIAEVGLVDVRLDTDQTQFAVPCPTEDCLQRGFIKGDFREGQPLSFGVRLDSLSHARARIPGMDGGSGGIYYQKSTSNPLHLDIQAQRANLQGNLTPLPAQGRLTYEVAENETGVLTDLDLSWESQTPIQRGNFSLLLKADDTTEPDHRLSGNFSGFTELETHLEKDCTCNASRNGTVFNATSEDGIEHLFLQYGPALGGNTSVFSSPSSTDSHYVLWDNQTVTLEDLPSSDSDSKESAGEELVWLRTWNFKQARVNTSAGRGELETTQAMSRPAELTALRGIYTADVTASNLPQRIAFDWTPTESAEEKTFTWDASDRVDVLDLDVTKRENTNATEDGSPFVTQLVSHVEGIPERVEAEWRGNSAFNVTTPNAGSVGSIDALFLNRTGDHGNADPVTVPDGYQGLVHVNTTDPTLTGSDSAISPALKQTAVRLEGLESVRVDRTGTPDTIHIERSDQPAATDDIHRQALVTHANQTALLDLSVSQAPENVSLEILQKNQSETQDGNRTERTHWNLDADASGPFGDGNLSYRSKPSDADTEDLDTSANLELEAIPADFEIDAVRKRHGPVEQLDGTTSGDRPNVTGFDRLEYLAGSGTLSLSGDVTINGTEFFPHLENLPETVHANISAPRSQGFIDASGSGVGRIDILVKPENTSTVRKLGENHEGILSSTAQASNKTAHARITNLTHAEWNLTGGVLNGNESRVVLNHTDTGSKGIRLSIQRQGDDGQPVRLDANLSDLPSGWTLTLSGNHTVGKLDYDANESIPELSAQWSRGIQNVTTRIEELGAHHTGVEFNLTDGWEASVHADNPPDSVTARAKRGGNYLELSADGLPENLVADVANGTRAGVVQAFNTNDQGDRTSATVDRVDLFRGTCPKRTKAGHCESLPTRPTRDQYEATEDLILRHAFNDQNDTDTRKLPNHTSNTFVYAEDFEEARWSLQAPSTPNWTAVNLDRGDRVERIDLNVTILGTGTRPDMRVQADVDELPLNTTAMIHLPGEGLVDRGDHVDKPPRWFTLPEIPNATDVKAGDIFANFDKAGWANATQPRIVFENTKDKFVVQTSNQTDTSSNGLPTGLVHLKPGDAGSSGSEDMLRGYDGRLSFEEPVDLLHLAWERRIPEGETEATTNVTPKFANLNVSGLPSEVQFYGTIPTDDCQGSDCTGQVGVDVLEDQTSTRDTIGEIDAVLTWNSSKGRTWDPVLPDVGPDELVGNKSAADRDYVQVHERRPASDNDVNRDLTTADLQVRDLEEAIVQIQHKNDSSGPERDEVGLIADLAGERNIDAYWTRTPPEDEQSDGKDLGFVGLRFDDFDGRITGLYSNTSDGRTTVAGTIDTVDAFDLYVEGNAPFTVKDYEARDYWLNVTDVKNSVNFQFENAQSSNLGRPTVRLDTHQVGKLAGQVHLETTATYNADRGANCDSGGIRLRVNAHPDARTNQTHAWTGGEIHTVNLHLFTPNANSKIKNSDNWIEQVRKCGDGQDQWGIHTEVTGLQKLLLDRYTDTTGSKVTHLETKISDDTAPRDFKLRKKHNEKITRLWSERWPNTAAAHLARPTLKDIVVPFTSKAWVEGGGGKLTTCPKERCWTFLLEVPLTENNNPPLGVTGRLQVRQQILADETAFSDDRAELDFNIGAGVVELATRNAVEGGLKFTSNSADIASKFAFSAWNGAQSDLSSLAAEVEADLDGAETNWSDAQVVSHLERQGPVHVRHSAEGYGMRIDADGGSFNGTNVYNKTIEDRLGTHDEIRRSRTQSHPNPLMWWISGYEKTWVPDCVWEPKEDDPCGGS